jgi:hypothetical protein
MTLFSLHHWYRWTVAGILFAVAASVVSASNAAENTLRLLPSEIQLTGPESRHRILVEQFEGSEAKGVVAEYPPLVSEDPSVARIENDLVIPVGDGTTIIRLESGDTSNASVRVTVSGFKSPHQWSFRNHVLPVLARQGCNSGACHGALAGKGGFRLSLRGYDPDRDYFNIVHQQQGRRAEPAEPAASLLLTKPTMVIPHKGGLRLEPGSRNYRVLAEWIASGAAGPDSQDAQIVELRIIPERVTLKPTASQPPAQNAEPDSTDSDDTKTSSDSQTIAAQPFIVQATYSDGRIEDVTSWAKFTSSNEAVALVDENGDARVIGPGEGAVTAWFSSQIAIARITVPYENQIDTSVYAGAARRNFIDDVALKQLERLRLQPADRCTDEAFIRRVFIDTIGTLPTSAEVTEFLADQTADKRDRLIERLLSRSEFVDYWTYVWSDVLLINGTEIRPDAVKAYYKWTREHVEKNTPWDQFVRELVTSRGASFENGATNFFALHQAPEDMAENVSQAFLGLSIGCARCHNHPLEKWTNDQYYAFANLFSRVRAKGWGGDPRSGDGNRTLVTVSSGELIQPRTGKPQPPAPLDSEPIPFDSALDRREYLAAWLTAPDNTLFSRSITNRVWKNFFGVGLVEQVDDLRTSNPASNDELLTAAAGFLSDSGFDLKVLMRTILQSETYQRSSLTSHANTGDQRHYSRYFPRRMMAEVLLDAVSQITEVPTEFTQVRYPGADVRKTDFYPIGTRAIQLYDSAVESYFLQTFGRNQRRITCECERSDEPSMVQVLHIANGNTLNGKLQSKDNRLSRWLTAFPDNGQLIDEVFLTCLARLPKPEERQELVTMLAEIDPAKDAAGRRELLEDIVWSVLSSREFLFNH